MLVTAIDRRTGIVTYIAGDLEMPVQEDRDLIPYLRVGGTSEDAEHRLADSMVAERATRAYDHNGEIY